MTDILHLDGSRIRSRYPTRHVILTRFNVRYVEDPNAVSIGIDPGWLSERFALFEKYCLPSILGQTCQDFSWILFFDTATPEPFLSRARALATEYPRTFPLFCQALPIELVQKTIEDIFPEQPDWLLTTRLDNDDGLHMEFVATIQAAQNLDRAEVLNCPTGIIARDDRVYLRNDPSNAFITLSEPFAGFKTVFSILRHVYAHESYPVRQLSASPRWLQVVHDNNISNRVRGWRVAMRRVANGFPALADASSLRENFASILAENLTMYFVRLSRDLAAMTARRVARLFGIDLRRKVAPGRSQTSR